ncbi:hypothetical protein P152DRAFT_88875 [Eremomyces bilateralis CBS 781.70]|uniref:DUF6987 domain-containing protein n=1 Tax=Eremomyces bilateralis CBS 781.70 TaxID=1392243 RepID=A0A6G1FXI6_9PEZI|nr:uncharacterized protein P152DRAFT_88875 [Eremomyces bilateralis CBS 781.70]KAF1810547.1 hypothetical protein P152DRAFT_88875 [Eremomyces bilateralis CBS 781.70]
MNNSLSYAYYSFPPTSNRISPSSQRSTNSTPIEPQTPTKPSRTPRTSKLMAPTPAAGKTGSTPRTPGKTPTKLGRKPQSAVKNPSESTAEPKDKAKELPEQTGNQVEMKDDDDVRTGKESQTSGELEEQEPKPLEDDEDTTAGAKDTTAGAEGDAEDTADNLTEKAGDTADDVEDTEDTDEGQDVVGGATESAQKKGGDILSGARGLAGRASGLAGKASKDSKDTAQGASEHVPSDAGDAQQPLDDAAEGVKETTEETTEDPSEDADNTATDLRDQAGEAAGQDLPDVPDLSILKGLEVQDDGLVVNQEGSPIGKLAEGDAEDLAGYQIGDDGEILDDDGDLVGRCELLPDALKDQIQKAKEEADSATGNVPDVSILKGLTVDATGQIINDDGDFIGQLVEGDPADLQGREINEKGEILDDDGDVIGRAQVHPDAANIVDQAKEGAEAATEEAGDVAGEAVEDAADETGEAIDGAQEAAPELPGIEALEGKKINEEGEVVDDDGNVLAQLAEGEVDQVKGLTLNDQGEVIDADGNVLGKVELTDGAAEKLGESVSPHIRILEGLKVNKKGKVLDEEGEVIGELTEGDAKDVAGKAINGNGEVLDKSGNVIGKVQVVPGDAANDAMVALQERLGDVVEPQLKETVPDLDILEGLKVNKKGQVLNEDGDPVGELIEGEIADCAGKKINDQGEVLDSDGNIIGKVQPLAQQVGEDIEGGSEADEEAGEGDNLPPLSILEGLKVNKAGKLINDDGVVVGELTEGDAKRLSKLGVTCDGEGQFWDSKGRVIGRAQTVQVEEHEEEGPFAGLEGLIVTKDGGVQDGNGNIVGQVTEGDPKKLVGRAVDEDGDIIDKRGSVVGHAERVDEEEAPEAEPVDLSSLAGRPLNKQGNIIGDEGVPIGRLVEGNAKELSGKQPDADGNIWNDSGKVIGRVDLIPENERETKPEGVFGGLQGLKVAEGGKVVDEDGNEVGQIVDGNAKRLVGMSVDEDGDIIDKYGNVKGHAEPLEEAEEEEVDLSILDGKTLNKQGFVVGDDGIPIGRLVEGNAKDLAGRKCDGDGQIHNDTGKVVGRCELIPENERAGRGEGPFAGYEGLRVNRDGKVEDIDGNVVGVLSEGDSKRLVGHQVDEDGDIIDKYGNVKGHADTWQEEEEAPEDLSALGGCTVNKAGNVVDSSGNVVGRVAEGEAKQMVGKKVDGKGQIWDNAGNVIGRAEIVKGADTTPDGPFSGFDSLTVVKDGTVQTPDGSIVGRIIDGDIKKLVGHHPDTDGEIQDKNGNTIGKAERWEPEEKERVVSPMSGLRVNKEGEVRDNNGDILGRLTAGDLGHCAGMEVDDNGNVVDNDGNKVGEVTLLEHIQEEEPEEKTEDAELADKMANICQQTLERIQPVCKQITDYIEKADSTPREELDEEELVNNVKPLIEEGGRILQECNGALRGLDPDGRIASQAKGRAATREATPEEYRLADLLKELTTTVVTTIDNAKKRISDMPHAKKKLNPLWSLLTEPLFQILAAVGLLLAGVLGLVGRLLSGLGLGGLVNGLLGGLGIDKLLGGLGLGSITDALGGGKKDKKKGGAGSLPLVGGLLGGGK